MSSLLPRTLTATAMVLAVSLTGAVPAAGLTDMVGAASAPAPASYLTGGCAPPPPPPPDWCTPDNPDPVCHPPPPPHCHHGTSPGLL